MLLWVVAVLEENVLKLTLPPDAMNGITEIIGPLIAYAVTFYNGGAFGNGPWRLLYVVFGLFTFVLGIVVLVFMPSNPMTAHFLTKEEKRIALERVRSNASGTAQKRFKASHVKEAVLDVRIWFSLLFVVLSEWRLIDMRWHGEKT